MAMCCRMYGNEASCRKVLQKAVNSASDDPEKVCNTLIRFEREQGEGVATC